MNKITLNKKNKLKIQFYGIKKTHLIKNYNKLTYKIKFRIKKEKKALKNCIF